MEGGMGGGGCYNGGAVQILEQGHQVLRRSTLCGTAELEWPPFVKYTPRPLPSLFSATPRKWSSRKRCLSPPLPKLLIRHASVVPGCPRRGWGRDSHSALPLNPLTDRRRGQFKLSSLGYTSGSGVGPCFS